MGSEPLKYDAMVIGSGISGVVAAASLRHRGQSVALVSGGGGATSVTSGSWDFGPPVGHGTSLSALCESDPWRSRYRELLVSDGFTPDGHGFIQTSRWLAEELRGFLALDFSFDRPFVLPTTAGTWKHTFGAQKIHSCLDLCGLGGTRVVLVGDTQWRFPHRQLIRMWTENAEQLGKRVDIKPLTLNVFSGVDWPLPRVAVALEKDGALKGSLLASLRDALSKTHCDLLMFPPIFVSQEQNTEWSNQLGLPVGECLPTIEPTAGFRLQGALGALVKAIGVHAYKCASIIPQVIGRRVKGLSCHLRDENRSTDFLADRFILATGKYFGGGIHFGYHDVGEAIFGLPLFYSRSCSAISRRIEIPWSDRAFTQTQPWVRMGVWVDREWRPVDDMKNPRFENLAACGSVIGGVDFARENIGLGFMAHSGRQCGLMGA